MNKCLVTKLNGVTSNNTLPRLGSIAVSFKQLENPTEFTQGLGVTFKEAATAKIVGNAYFTDKTLTENKGTELSFGAGENSSVFVSNGDCKVYFTNKYALSELKRYAYSSNYPSTSTGNKTLSLDDLKYSNSINILDLNTNANGSIESLSNKKDLLSVVISGKDITGDINSFKECVNLSSLMCTNANVTGNISFMRYLPSIQSVNLYGTVLSGDISSLQNCTKATSLEFYASNEAPITGDLASLVNLNKLSKLSITYNKLSGDLSKMPASFNSIVLDGCNSSFIWSERNSSCKAISIKGGPIIDNVDKMLNDQANCILDTSGVIEVTGSRTTASDIAVQKLQSHGYTVSITPA